MALDFRNNDCASNDRSSMIPAVSNTAWPCVAPRSGRLYERAVAITSTCTWTRLTVTGQQKESQWI